jgi:protein-disulfide isomerase
MAEPVNLKSFYALLAVLAALGIALLWWARGGGGADAAAPAPVPITTAAFDGYVLGSDSAPVTVIEYSNFECGWCARFAMLTMPDVKRRLIDSGLVRFKFRDFLLSEDPVAATAHLAAACAAEQGRFWEMHDQIFFNQGRWLRDSRPARVLRGYASQVGLDLDRYDGCMDERRYEARILATRNEGAAMGVGSTPTFVIGGRLESGYKQFDQFRALVEQAR